MNPQPEQRLLKRLDARLEELDLQSGCSWVTDSFPLRSMMDVREAAHAHVLYEYPCSAYLLLRCMRWALSPPVPVAGGTWRCDLDALLFLLAPVQSVHEPADAVAHQEEFMKWNTIDVDLVCEWLDMVGEHSFVRECDRQEWEKACSFWKGL